MSFLINPFAFAVAGGDFESIATVTVGSGGATFIDFTNISGLYAHLQLRLVARSSAWGNPRPTIRFNSDSANNYNSHWLQGDGANATSSDGTTPWFGNITTTNDDAGMFGVAIVDILDYANTSKNTTVRSAFGKDSQYTGQVGISSVLWRNTAAVTSIRLSVDDANASFQQHSTAALYGVMAP
jgi:hypothetical protein